MKKLILFAALAALMFSACKGDKKAVTRLDTLTTGEAVIVCDESFAPIIKEEIAVFSGLNREAHITPVFTSEKEVFRLLMIDSIRMAIAARDLTENEKEHFKNIRRIPRSQRIAIDGIALIINKNNRDTLISLAALENILTGKTKYWHEIFPENRKTSELITVVFDNKNSSTLRFIQDSICKNRPVSPDLFAASTSEAVIDYVSNHPGALGIIGVNWISNPNDSTKLSFDNKIQVMAISRSNQPTAGNSYKPFPAYLATGDYPLTRDVYAILTDVRGGLPAGFVSFIAGDSGQRIILKAGLVPATRPTRLINMKTDFE